MQKIEINVSNKIATLKEKFVGVCGNSDYVVVFDFDDEWKSHSTKTARFKHGGQYIDVVFTGKDGSDANVTAENIQSALGYTPVTPSDLAAKQDVLTDADKQSITKIGMTTGAAWTADEQKAARERMGVDKEYELIETITVMDEEIRLIERTIEPNGTNYNFKVVYLHCIVPKAEQSGFMFTYINGNIHAAMQGSISNVGNTFGQAMAECKYGMIEGYGMGARDVGTSGLKSRYITSVNVPGGHKNINSLKISSTVSIPINTVIKIWGVRA